MFQVKDAGKLKAWLTCRLKPVSGDNFLQSDVESIMSLISEADSVANLKTNVISELELALGEEVETFVDVLITDIEDEKYAIDEAEEGIPPKAADEEEAFALEEKKTDVGDEDRCSALERERTGNDTPLNYEFVNEESDVLTLNYEDFNEEAEKSEGKTTTKCVSPGWKSRSPCRLSSPRRQLYPTRRENRPRSRNFFRKRSRSKSPKYNKKRRVSPKFNGKFRRSPSPPRYRRHSRSPRRKFRSKSRSKSRPRSRSKSRPRSRSGARSLSPLKSLLERNMARIHKPVIKAAPIPMGIPPPMGVPLMPHMPLMPFVNQPFMPPPVFQKPSMKHMHCFEYHKLGYCLKGDFCPFYHSPDATLLADLQPQVAASFVPPNYLPPPLPPPPVLDPHVIDITMDEDEVKKKEHKLEKEKNLQIVREKYRLRVKLGHVHSAPPPGISQTTIEVKNIPEGKHNIPSLLEAFSPYGDISMVQVWHDIDQDSALLRFSLVVEAVKAMKNAASALPGCTASWFKHKCAYKDAADLMPWFSSSKAAPPEPQMEQDKEPAVYEGSFDIFDYEPEPYPPPYRRPWFEDSVIEWDPEPMDLEGEEDEEEEDELSDSPPGDEQEDQYDLTFENLNELRTMYETLKTRLQYLEMVPMTATLMNELKTTRSKMAAVEPVVAAYDLSVRAGNPIQLPTPIVLKVGSSKHSKMFLDSFRNFNA